MPVTSRDHRRLFARAAQIIFCEAGAEPPDKRTISWAGENACRLKQILSPDGAKSHILNFLTPRSILVPLAVPISGL